MAAADPDAVVGEGAQVVEAPVKMLLLLIAFSAFPPSPFAAVGDEPGDGVARAVITDQFGNPLPITRESTTGLIVFSARKSVHGAAPGSVKWSVFPEEYNARKWVPNPDGLEFGIALEGQPVTLMVILSVASGDTVDHLVLEVKCGNGPRPPPVPPKPEPEPGPKPTPVASFRAIFVFESSQTLPPEKSSIKDARAVKEYLNAKATKEGGHPGWRSWDVDTNAASESPNMKALWEAVQPKITTVPCLVVEVNGKADIVPWPANADECLATLRTYGGP